MLRIRSDDTLSHDHQLGYYRLKREFKITKKKKSKKKLSTAEGSGLGKGQIEFGAL